MQRFNVHPQAYGGQLRRTSNGKIEKKLKLEHSESADLHQSGSG